MSLFETFVPPNDLIGLSLTLASLTSSSSSDALHLQYNYGWKELAWVAQVSPIVFLYAGAAPRLRKASLVRNHQTPSDFITDMFQCQLLRYGVIIIQIAAQFIWMTSNVVAVKNSFNMAFHLDEDSPWM